jgi:hypothetical protein
MCATASRQRYQMSSSNILCRYIAACEARDDLHENMQSLKSSLKLKADEAEHR